MTKLIKKRKYDVAKEDDIVCKKACGAPDMVRELRVHDVLLGRGAQINHYEGNMRFRELIKQRKDDYSATTNRRLKDSIAREIVSAVLENEGRFLRKYDDSADNKDSPWVVVNQEIAVEKAKQALRDQECKSSTESKNQGKNSDSPEGAEPSEEPVITKPAVVKSTCHINNKPKDEMVDDTVDKLDKESARSCPVGPVSKDDVPADGSIKVLIKHAKEGHESQEKAKPRLSMKAGTSVSRLRKLQLAKYGMEDDDVEGVNNKSDHIVRSRKAAASSPTNQSSAASSGLTDLEVTKRGKEDIIEQDVSRIEDRSDRSQERQGSKQSDVDVRVTSVMQLMEQQQLQRQQHLFAQANGSNLSHYPLESSLMAQSALRQPNYNPLLHGNRLAYPSSSFGGGLSLADASLLSGSFGRPYGFAADNMLLARMAMEQEYAARQAQSTTALAAFLHRQKSENDAMLQSLLLRQSNLAANSTAPLTNLLDAGALHRLSHIRQQEAAQQLFSEAAMYRSRNADDVRNGILMELLQRQVTDRLAEGSETREVTDKTD